MCLQDLGRNVKKMLKSLLSGCSDDDSLKTFVSEVSRRCSHLANPVFDGANEVKLNVI